MNTPNVSLKLPLSRLQLAHKLQWLTLASALCSVQVAAAGDRLKASAHAASWSGPLFEPVFPAVVPKAAASNVHIAKAVVEWIFMSLPFCGRSLEFAIPV
ncbi:hypothetical protein IFT63_01940 [Stenotrophomonas sp. CFBP 13724]|uniref:hypothetical protein n=1 Tax=Stenotrophomonas sp. CFBP 13724 TaxID=2775298 RepID=UPI00178678E0|nr:hypothetical protein [Stenotrophomonas sp. CFBP 13724]MBD8642349.1 hypothetical protein [Stenotrophomonas sp. CFBP 13724]